jgi:hypothetical protein
VPKERGIYRAAFAAVLLLIDGALNIIYGFAAIGNSSYFAHPTHFIFGNLSSWGWVSLIIGIVQTGAAISLTRGNAFGRYVGIAVGSLAAIAALLDIDAAPFWSLAVFGISIYIVHGLATYSDPQHAVHQHRARAHDELPPIQPGPLT